MGVLDGLLGGAVEIQRRKYEKIGYADGVRGVRDNQPLVGLGARTGYEEGWEKGQQASLTRLADKIGNYFDKK